MANKILQIMSVQGYEAIYKDIEEEKTEGEMVDDVICFALLEDEDGFRYVEAMVLGDYGTLDFVSEIGNFEKVRKKIV